MRFSRVFLALKRAELQSPSTLGLMSSSAVSHERAAAGRHLHEIATLGVVLVAAGRGVRLGSDTPKAYTMLGGLTLVEHCVGAISALPHNGHLVIVTPQGEAAHTLSLVERSLPADSAWQVSVVAGGRERHESVRFGVDALPEYVTTVLVHDAARPLAPVTLFDRVIDEVLRTRDAVIPALPVVDTVKRVDASGVVHETVDRSALVAVQTPQGFPRELLAAAHEAVRMQSLDDRAAGASALPTDDAEVVQRAGAVVRTVPGDPLAHKLTTPADVTILEAFLDGVEAASRGASRDRSFGGDGR